MNKKAIVLYSGGLDSMLAVKLMQEQGIETEAVNFFIEFAECGGRDDTSWIERSAAMLGAPLKVVDITTEYLEVFKNPKHGYGANINPCIDCKIFMLKKAKEMMASSGASFLVTGEVLGERPMSQRRDALNIIEKQAGVKGILLRPLSAKLLDPTMPEKEGLVDRERLLDISGRSRKPQMELARKFGIREYPNPAGGCLLTDPGFSKRVRELIAHGELTVDNLKLLKWGRHFRLGDKAKLAVGRDCRENTALEKLALKDDIIFKMKSYQGPISVLRGASDKGTIELAARIASYHTKFRNLKTLAVNYWTPGSRERTAIEVSPAPQEEIEKLRI